MNKVKKEAVELTNTYGEEETKDNLIALLNSILSEKDREYLLMGLDSGLKKGIH